ncbi:conserved hypothetical protein [Trichinella spiralis]|uniref:hypothetical protein n=1 Tax=Trichinella spiralis TaxID=6334 RepID=UPI0001EFD979|nr:conserved hypothetical protein [Trichinella spiralis]
MRSVAPRDRTFICPQACRPVFTRQAQQFFHSIVALNKRQAFVPAYAFLALVSRINVLSSSNNHPSAHFPVPSFLCCVHKLTEKTTTKLLTQDGFSTRQHL